MVERLKRPSAIPPSPSFPVPRVEFSNDNRSLTARLITGESVEILLYGATITSWKSAGRENLFLSEKAHLDGSKPVRGGIPLVFPVFGPPPSDGPLSSLPQHGFARTSRWEFLGKNTSESEGMPRTSPSDSSVRLDFGLDSSNISPEARKAFPHSFGLIYSVTLARESLETTMLVRNEGQESFEFQLLMHTYLRVEDIAKTRVTGLDGCRYIDKVQGGSEHAESQSQVQIDGETDRMYQSVPLNTPVTVMEDGEARFEISRDSLDDVVVWNPGSEKAAGMSDFGPKDGWKKMLCVEAGSVAGWQTLAPGDTFEGGQTIKQIF